MLSLYHAVPTFQNLLLSPRKVGLRADGAQIFDCSKGVLCSLGNLSTSITPERKKRWQVATSSTTGRCEDIVHDLSALDRITKLVAMELRKVGIGCLVDLGIIGQSTLVVGHGNVGRRVEQICPEEARLDQAVLDA